MKIKRFVGGSLESNCYVISVREGGGCYIIDPGYEPRKIAEYVIGEGLRPLGVILTHNHHDHAGAAARTADILNCPVTASFEDSLGYRGKVDRCLEDGERLDLDGEELIIRKTPGHTEGSICIEAPASGVVFTGDTIFDTDLGRTDLAGGSEQAMTASCAEVIDRWPDRYVIYPGHDEKASMATVRRYNEEFLQRLEEYRKWK